jgi:hypothetical protein
MDPRSSRDPKAVERTLKGGFHVRLRLASCFIAAAAVLALSVPISAQDQGKGKGKGGGKGGAPQQPVVHKPIPRTVDGKPDISGVWQGGGVSVNGEAGAPPLHPLPPIDAHPIAREPLVYKPEFDAKRKTFTTLDDPTLICLLPGIPRITGMPMPLEIVQTPKEVVMLYESFRAWRRIPIEANLKHPDDVTPTWMGDAVGRWEGDTFVVDSIGFNDKTWIAGTGTVHSEQMHVVEHYNLQTDGSLVWDATVEDPVVLTKPYKTGGVLRAPIGVRVEEYECIENNPDREHMLKAAELEKNKK